MRQIQHYQLDTPQCVLFKTNTATTLTVSGGLLWATIDGAPHDHWLRAGDTLELAPSQRVWLSAEGGPVELKIAQNARLSAFLWRHARRRLSLRAQGGTLTHFV